MQSILRCLVVAAAYLAVLAAPSSTGLPKLPLSDNQQEALYRVLKWVLALFLIFDVNNVLNEWAENRWVMKSDKSSWDWPKEVAVVTGGSGGIGAMVVQRLMSYGVKVAVLDIQPLSDIYTQDEREAIKFYRCDVASRDSVHMAAEALRSDCGSPSILINNAGIGNSHTILETPPELVQKLISVNLISHWWTIQEFLPDMLSKRKGHIMSTSSMSAFVSFAGMADYAATKVGLVALHESLTAELKHRYKCPEIKTSIVFPTWTSTRLTSSIQQQIRSTGAAIHDPKDVAERMVDQIIAARSGRLLLTNAFERFAAPIARALPMWIQEIVRDRAAQLVTGNMTTAIMS